MVKYFPTDDYCMIQWVIEFLGDVYWVMPRVNDKVIYNYRIALAVSEFVVKCNNKIVTTKTKPTEEMKEVLLGLFPQH